MTYRRVNVTFCGFRHAIVSFCDFRRVSVSFGNPTIEHVIAPVIVTPTIEPVIVTPTITKGIYERFRRLISIPSKDNAHYTSMAAQYQRYILDLPTYTNSVTCSAEPKSMYLPEEMLMYPDTFKTILTHNNFVCSVTEKYQKVIVDPDGNSVIKHRKRLISEHQKVFLCAYTPKVSSGIELTDIEKARALKYAKESGFGSEMYPAFNVEVRSVQQHYKSDDVVVYKVLTSDGVSDVNLYTATQLRNVIASANVGDLLCVTVYTFLHAPDAMPKVFVTSAVVYSQSCM